MTTHHIVVDIGRARVAVSEYYHGGHSVRRCEVSRAIWNAVASDAQMEFKRRAKEKGVKFARWHAGENSVERLLGKELLVLLWAVDHDDVTSAEIATAIRNWLGLKPEERWWLCTAACSTAATGKAEGRDIGWRTAIRAGLCFDPHTAMECAA